MKKAAFDILFIGISAGILILLNYYGYLDKMAGFSLIPILIAYYLGQFSQKRFEK